MKIEILTQRHLIRAVAKRWQQQYGGTSNEEWLGIMHSLEGLDRETATADEVNKIIGNESWTRLEMFQLHRTKNGWG